MHRQEAKGTTEKYLSSLVYRRKTDDNFNLLIAVQYTYIIFIYNRRTIGEPIIKLLN